MVINLKIKLTKLYKVISYNLILVLFAWDESLTGEFSMNKAMLVENMSKITKLPKVTCKECLEALVKTIGQAMKQKKSVVLTGFGTFTVMERQARTGINPATGQKMRIKAKKVPKFRPGKALKDMVG